MDKETVAKKLFSKAWADLTLSQKADVNDEVDRLSKQKDTSEADAINYMKPSEWKAWLAQQNYTDNERVIAQRKYDANVAADAKKAQAEAKAAADDAKKLAGPNLADITKGLQDKQTTTNLTSQAKSSMSEQAIQNFIMGNSGGAASSSAPATAPAANTSISPAAEQWRELVSRYFKPEDVDKALSVIQGESGGNAGNLGDGGHSIGLFQLNDAGGLGTGMSAEARKDAETNIKTAAAAVYGGSGWAPWGENNSYNGQPFGALGGGKGSAAAPTPSGWWSAPITQGFGPTDEPLDSAYGGAAHFNKGLDFGVAAGTSITSNVAGKVIASGPQSDGWGTSVKIQTPDGLIHNYGHLSSAAPKVGDEVKPGDVLGSSGSTGNSTGPHLSYDVYDAKGNYIDPTKFLPGASSRVGPAGGQQGALKDAPAAPAPKPFSLPPDWHVGPTGYEQDVSVPGAGGGYKATGVLGYDDKTGNVSKTDVGFTNPIQGMSLDPRNTWWGTGLGDAAGKAGLQPDQLIERWRSLPTAELAKTIRQVLGREPTAADLLSPPGGAMVNGDPMQRENAAAIAKTGQSMMGAGYKTHVDPFNTANSTGPIAMNDAPEMTQQGQHNYLVTGSTNPGAAELGGRTMGELETQQAYGSDPAPAGAKQEVMSNIDSGRIFDFDQLMKKYGMKAHQDGAMDVAGLEDPNKKPDWMTNNVDTSAILGNGGVQGDKAAYWWQNDGQDNYGWQKPNWSPVGNSAQLSQNFAANLGPGSPTRWDDVAKRFVRNPYYDEQESYSRGTNHNYNYTGTGHGPGLSPFSGTFFDSGGPALAGMDMGSIFPGWGLIQAERAGIPSWMHGNLYTYMQSQKYGGGPNGYNPGTATPTNTPTSWAPTPVTHAGGGTDLAGSNGFTTGEPLLLSGLNSGKPMGVTGEAGAEAVVNVPLTRPAEDPLAAQVQQLPAIQQMMQTQTGGRFSSSLLSGLNGGTQTATMQGAQPGFTDPALIKAAAKAARPKVKLAV